MEWPAHLSIVGGGGVTEDLERLNMTNLIGTNLLRAYMHGFFIDHRLYKKVTQPSCLCLLFVKEMMSL